MSYECEKYCKLRQEHRKHVKLHYTPLHSHVYTLKEDIFVPSFVEAIRASASDSLHKILTEERPGIYSFEMLQSNFCNRFLEEIVSYKSWCEKENIDVQPPNSMNNYGVILDDLGFGPFLKELMTKYVTPLSGLLFKDVGGDSLDENHGFIVEYGMEKDTSLGFHTDDSEITLNVCLGKHFTGGTLYFEGLREHECLQTSSLQNVHLEIMHKIGRAILIQGQQMHGANDITSGERYNLIMWCKSSKFRQEHNVHAGCSDGCEWRTQKAE